MARRVLSALLHNGVSIGDPLNGYAFIFYFSFRFRKTFKYIWPIKSLPAYFKKAPINPVYSNFNIAVSFTDKSINLKLIFVEIWNA